MKPKRKKWDGISMPEGKCLIASNDDGKFKKQIDRLTKNDRKESRRLPPLTPQARRKKEREMKKSLSIKKLNVTSFNFLDVSK